MTPPQHRMPLASGIYRHPLSLRGKLRNWTVAGLACHDATAAGRQLRRLLRHYRRDDHVALARYHLLRAERLDQIWCRVLDRAAREAFGRGSTIFDYRICAIGREEFTAHHKRVLRHCAYNATGHRDLARAHYRAAGLRKEPTL